MKMTIKEAISWLISIAEYAGKDDISIYDEDAKAIEMAVEIMNKYQEIEQIIDDWENSGEEDDPINIIDNIEEVIEDGND